MLPFTRFYLLRIADEQFLKSTVSQSGGGQISRLRAMFRTFLLFTQHEAKPQRFHIPRILC